MVLERTQIFRLVERGRAGLACDGEGISLGAIALVTSDPDAHGALRYVARSASDVGDILGAAYGSQREEVVQRCHRGLRRAASALQANDLALAGIEAVMLCLPELDPDAIAKLAKFHLEKGGDSWSDEPRVPAGQSAGGQWTTGGPGASVQRPARRPLHPNPHHRGSGRQVAAPSDQTRPPTGAARPPSASAPTAPHEQSRSNGPVSAFVDFSNTVASRLVDAAHWLQQPAGEVPIAPEIAAGDPNFPMGAALEETADPNAFRDWRPVSHLEVGADALSVAGAVAGAANVAIDGPESAGQAIRFSSAWKLRQYLGSPGEGNQWHHIVEQTPSNLRTFGAEAIHSTDNVIAVPKPIHVGKNSISALYSSKARFSKGLTVRRWLSTQSFRAQRQFGIKILKSRGQWK